MDYLIQITLISMNSILKRDVFLLPINSRKINNAEYQNYYNNVLCEIGKLINGCTSVENTRLIFPSIENNIIHIAFYFGLLNLEYPEELIDVLQSLKCLIQE